MDWIVMKCLEKDRTRRYETANGLARDVQRYLSDEAVEACPPSAAYKLRKFGRKHRKALVTAATFAVLLLAGTALNAWQAVRATVAEGEAVRQRIAAVANEEKAWKGEQAAGRERDEVRGLNDRLRRLMYTSQMSLAHHAWNGGGLTRLKELLDEARPKPGQDDLRGFEWHYLHRLYESGRLKLQGKGNQSFNCFAVSRDGKRLATNVFEGGSNQGVLKVWDSVTGSLVRILRGHEGSVWGAAFSPDGARLASAGSDKVVRVWDLADGREVLTLVGHSYYVNGVAFSPDGTRIASAGNDDVIRVWSTAGGPEIFKHEGHTGAIQSVAYSPDGSPIASASDDGTVKFWDLRTAQVTRTLEAHAGWAMGVAYSPDGSRLASAGIDSAGFDASICIHDPATGKVLHRLAGHTGEVISLAFNRDGTRLASVGHDKTLRVWDVKGGRQLLSLPGHKDFIWGVAFSPDGTRIATSSIDHTVNIWDADRGVELFTIPAFVALHSVAYSPNGARLAAGGDDGIVFVWETTTGRELLAMKGHSDIVGSPSR